MSGEVMPSVRRRNPSRVDPRKREPARLRRAGPRPPATQSSRRIQAPTRRPSSSPSARRALRVPKTRSLAPRIGGADPDRRRPNRARACTKPVPSHGPPRTAACPDLREPAPHSAGDRASRRTRPSGSKSQRGASSAAGSASAESSAALGASGTTRACGPVARRIGAGPGQRGSSARSARSICRFTAIWFCAPGVPPTKPGRPSRAASTS